MKKLFFLSLALALIFVSSVSAMEDDALIEEAHKLLGVSEIVEDADDMAGLKGLEDLEKELGYGTVYGEVSDIDIPGRLIEILQFDYDIEEEVGVTYYISESVELAGAKELSGINEGDWVDLEYQTDEDGNMTVNFISVEIEPLPEPGEDTGSI